MNPDLVVRCRNLGRTYDAEAVPVHALRGVDLDVAPGEFVSLAGPSGSGKSTLLNLIGALDRPSSGEVIVDGVALAGLDEAQLADLRLTKIGFVFQAYNLIPVLSARENVEFIMQLQGVPAGRTPRARARNTGVARHGGTRESPARRNVRRPAAARRRCTRDRHAPGVAAGGRAERESRFRNDERTARTAEAHQRGTARHDRHRDARPDGDELRAQTSATVGRTHRVATRGFPPRPHEGADSHAAVRRRAPRGLRRSRGISMRGRALFGNAESLPEDDLQRSLDGTPAYEASADLRLMFRDEYAGWHLNAALTTLYEVGDQFAFISNPQDTLDQTPRNDRLRYMDLTWTLEDGPRHENIQRFDRLAVEYRAEHWGVTVGPRRDQLGQRHRVPAARHLRAVCADDGRSRLQARRGPGEDRRRDRARQRLATASACSGETCRAIARRRSIRSAANGTACSASYEVELLGAKHYRDRVAGVSVKRAIAGAVLRTDWLLTDLDDGGYKTSGAVNLDYSFTWLDRNWYVFGEYFHSGFGTNTQPVDLTKLPKALSVRLLRGELFTLMQDYSAVGARLEWHPLRDAEPHADHQPARRVEPGADAVRVRADRRTASRRRLRAEPRRNRRRVRRDRTAAAGERSHDRRRLAVVSALDVLLVTAASCGGRRRPQERCVSR